MLAHNKNFPYIRKGIKYIHGEPVLYDQEPTASGDASYFNRFKPNISKTNLTIQELPQDTDQLNHFQLPPEDVIIHAPASDSSLDDTSDNTSENLKNNSQPTINKRKRKEKKQDGPGRPKKVITTKVHTNKPDNTHSLRSTNRPNALTDSKNYFTASRGKPKLT